jgi:hypothetical protein
LAEGIGNYFVGNFLGAAVLGPFSALIPAAAAIGTMADMGSTIAANEGIEKGTNILKENPLAGKSLEDFSAALKAEGVTNEKTIEAIYAQKDAIEEQIREERLIEKER